MSDMIETTMYDRAEWPAGPWCNEPDRIEWRDAASGLVCLMKRNDHLLSWCGYVGVGPDHPLYGYNPLHDFGEDAVDLGPELRQMANAMEEASHGDITHADKCQEGDAPIEHRICHLAQPGEPDELWWFGFDAGHMFDLQPGLEEGLRRALPAEDWERHKAIFGAGRDRMPAMTYRTADYVRARCTAMAATLKQS